METFLEFLREILKGIVREVTAHLFRKNVLDHIKSESALFSPDKHKTNILWKVFFPSIGYLAYDLEGLGAVAR